MTLSISNCKLETLDTTAKLKQNLNFIEKLGLLASIA